MQNSNFELKSVSRDEAANLPVDVSVPAMGYRMFIVYQVVHNDYMAGVGNTIMDLSRPILSSEDLRELEEVIVKTVRESMGGKDKVNIIVTSMQVLFVHDQSTGEIVTK